MLVMISRRDLVWIAVARGAPCEHDDPDAQLAAFKTALLATIGDEQGHACETVDGQFEYDYRALADLDVSIVTEHVDVSPLLPWTDPDDPKGGFE